MSKFKIEQLKDITVTEELVDALSKYQGVIPLCLIPYLNRGVYDDNLKKHKLYDKIYQEYYQIRMQHKKSDDKVKFKENQFYEWLNNNSEFEEILSESIKK